MTNYAIISWLQLTSCHRMYVTVYALYFIWNFEQWCGCDRFTAEYEDDLDVDADNTPLFIAFI